MITETKREIHGTGLGSGYFGNCELCGKHASEIFVGHKLTKSIGPSAITGMHFWIKDAGTYAHHDCLTTRFGAHETRKQKAAP